MIYLSSYRMGQNADVIRASRANARVGIIFNALDQLGESRLQNWDREAADLKRLGYVSEELNLRQYFSGREGLVDRLAELDLVWVVGGNAFVLARAMTSCEFATALKPALDRGLIYAGYSAGACVAGPDLQGIDLIDDPSPVPEGYDGDIGPETLGLVTFRIVPHWQSDHPESAAAQRAVEYLERRPLTCRTMRDGEALILDIDAAGERRS